MSQFGRFFFRRMAHLYKKGYRRKYSQPIKDPLEAGLLAYMARPERFELPTAWFVVFQPKRPILL